MNIPSNNTLSGDERIPSIFGAFLPNDFDIVAQRIELQLKTVTSWINRIRLRGFFDSGIKTFLRRYIDSAIKYKRVYIPSEQIEWFEYFEKEYDYSRWETEALFAAFWKVKMANGIMESIYKPFEYTPPTGGAIEQVVTGVKKTVFDVVDATAKIGAKHLLTPVLIAGVIYLVSRETLFGRRRKLKK